jgi:L-fuconolactonase
MSVPLDPAPPVDTGGPADVIDAHLHLWNAGDGYDWLQGAPAPLRRTFTAAEAERELLAAGVASAVLVQAEDSTRDTQAMLAVAHERRWIAGVVGWVRLDDESEARAQLDALADEPLLVGIRHLVHDDPRDDFLALPAVRRSLRAVAEAGLAFDVPDAWPRHLEAVGVLATSLPELRIVVDHLAKPPRGGDDFEDWRRALRRVAASVNVVAKVSGLHVPGQPFDADALRPVWEEALEAFGPSRLMYGGDWPMTVPIGGYQPTWNVLRSLIDELSPGERDAVLAGTARRVYRLRD